MFNLLANLRVRTRLIVVLIGFGVVMVLMTALLTITTQNSADDSAILIANGQARALLTRINGIASEIVAQHASNENTLSSLEALVNRLIAYHEQTARLFIAVPDLDQAEFADFFAPTISGDQAGAVNFIEPFTDAQRQADPRPMVGFDADGNLAPAAQRDLYYVITFSTNAQPQNRLIDVASQPDLNDAIQTTLERRQLTISDVIRPADSAQSGFVILSPVYEADDETLRGIATLFISLRLALENVDSVNRSLAPVLTIRDQNQVLYDAPEKVSATEPRTFTLRLVNRLWRVTLTQQTDISALQFEIVENAWAMVTLAQSMQELGEYRGSLRPFDGEVDAALRAEYAELLAISETLPRLVNVLLELSSNTLIDNDTIPALQAQTQAAQAVTDRIEAQLQSSFNQRGERATLRALGLNLSAGLILVLSGVTIYFIVVSLRRLARTAEALGAGDLSARAGLMGENEFAQIGQGIDAMAQRVENLLARVQANEARYRLLAENLADLLIQTDADGVIEYASPAAEILFDYDPAGMIGRNVLEYIEAAERPAEFSIAGLGQRVVRFIRADGGYEFTEVEITPLPEGGYLSVWRDVTERVSADAERRRLQEEVITAQRQVIRDLQTPIIPLLRGVIIAPLVGELDEYRTREFMRALLGGIGRHGADLVLVDVTGVVSLDRATANHLNQAVQAAQLKGARVIVTGISPLIAEALVEAGGGWRNVETLASLEFGLAQALSRVG